MLNLSFAIGAFLASHMIPGLPAVRDRLIGLLGWPGYLIAYSLLSLTVLAWVGLAYAGAPYVELWAYDPALRWVPVLVMPVACALLVAGLVRPNPLSVSLWRGEGEVRGSGGGLFGMVRHPVPWAFGLWAAAHVVPNGDAASLLLFGLLGLLAAVGARGLDAKKRRTLGPERWAGLARRRPRLDGGQVAGAAAGLVLYGLLALLHQPVLGIAPWPPALADLIVWG